MLMLTKKELFFTTKEEMGIPLISKNTLRLSSICSKKWKTSRNYTTKKDSLQKKQNIASKNRNRKQFNPHLKKIAVKYLLNNSKQLISQKAIELENISTRVFMRPIEHSRFRNIVKNCIT